MNNFFRSIRRGRGRDSGGRGDDNDSNQRPDPPAEQQRSRASATGSTTRSSASEGIPDFMTVEGLRNMLHSSPEMFARVSEQFEQYQEQMFAAQEAGVAGTGGGGGGGLADFFANAAAAQQQEVENRGPPPASKRAIRQLPTIMVKPEDLVDETNRECCICLDDNNIKDRVIRLPCAHIFHPKCIIDWLSKRNSCPVCRYELMTDDPSYERKRLENMKNRKPRYAKYELERMEPIELRNLCTRLRINYPNKLTHKGELIMLILNSGKVDIIASPEPVEYPLSKLKSMRIKELKSTMEDAGVFFDPIDVIEKSDMISIFINSGRLVLSPEEVIDNDESEEEFDINGDNDGSLKQQEDDNSMGSTSNKRKAPPSPDRNKNDGNSSSNNNNVEPPIHVETVETTPPESARISSTDSSNHNSSWMEPIDNNDNEITANDEDNIDGSEEDDDYTGSNNGEDCTSTTRTETNIDESQQLEQDAVSEGQLEDVSMEDLTESLRSDSQCNEDTVANTDASANARLTSPEEEQFRLHCQEISISKLRIIATDLKVDLSDCIERREMIDRLANACYHTTCSSSNTFNQPTLTTNDLLSFNIVDLQTIKSNLGIFLIDLHTSNTDHNGIIEELVLSATTYPHVACYIRTLLSLSSKSISELRLIARQWNNININGCLEKSDIIHKMVLAGGPHHK